jgi:HEPN domain-containing protein
VDEMRKDKWMSLEEHYENANDLAIASHHLNRLFYRCQKHYPKTHRLSKLLWRVCPDVLSGVFTAIKSELDNEYFKAGHGDQDDSFIFIYYDLEKRYQMLMGHKGDS